jgi:hypothetical protein
VRRIRPTLPRVARYSTRRHSSAARRIAFACSIPASFSTRDVRHANLGEHNLVREHRHGDGEHLRDFAATLKPGTLTAWFVVHW